MNSHKVREIIKRYKSNFGEIHNEEIYKWQDKAIRTATVVLEERLREVGETEKINPGATADTIVNIAFSEKGKLLKK